MAVNIQELLDRASVNEEVRLPAGEFEGPFKVKIPCTVTGSNTTLWSDRGPVFVVDAPGVTLRDLQVEVISGSQYKGFFSIRTNYSDTKLAGVEVVGDLSGFPVEWRQGAFPRVLCLGEFYAQRENRFVFEVEVVSDVSLSCEMKDLTVKPAVLSPGWNQITITTDKLKEGAILYGELLFSSHILRRVYVSGKAVSKPRGYNGKAVFRAEKGGGAVSVPEDVFPPVVRVPDVLELKRGQRLAIAPYADKEMKIIYEHSGLRQPMEIDGYIFMLGDKGKVSDDSEMVYFDQPESADRAVSYREAGEKRIVCINFAAVRQDIARISLAYSIYGENSEGDFAKVMEPLVRMFVEDREIFRFSLQDLSVEKTVVAVDLYRHKGEWKLSAIGAGYRDGLRKLCASYGVNVDE